MPNLTTPFLKLSGDTQQDLKQIEKWSVALVDELKSVLCNLDSGNVGEAASVKAQNIDCTKAKIKDAQVQSMTADKLTAGTINTGEITVQGESDNGSMEMSGEKLEFYEKGNSQPRIYIGRDGDNYILIIQNSKGTQGIYMDDDGRVYMTGAIETTQDCLIQGELRVGLRGSNNKGIRFYGDAYFPDANGNYSAEYASILPHVSTDEKKGIEITGDLWLNGSPVVSQRGLSGVDSQIEAIDSRLERVEKMLDTMS